MAAGRSSRYRDNPQFSQRRDSRRASRGGTNYKNNRRSVNYRKDAHNAAVGIGKNIELLMVILFVLNIMLTIGWLVFAHDWYTAYCSEFVTKATDLNVTLPSTWKRSDFKGCDPQGKTIAQADDTLIYFGLNGFTHAGTTGALNEYQIFSLATAHSYFSSWEVILWIIVCLSVLGIIMAVTYWTIKTQNLGIMYTDGGIRAVFGPGSGFFAVLCFITSMMMHMDYRYYVKESDKNHMLNVANLDMARAITLQFPL